MTILDEDPMESRIPKKFGLDGTYIELKEKIADLEGYEFSLYDKKGHFEEIEKKYNFKLEQFFGGLNLMIDGKEKPISTPIFRNKDNFEELGILFWENKKPFLYSKLCVNPKS